MHTSGATGLKAIKLSHLINLTGSLIFRGLPLKYFKLICLSQTRNCVLRGKLARRNKNTKVISKRCVNVVLFETGYSAPVAVRYRGSRQWSPAGLEVWGWGGGPASAACPSTPSPEIPTDEHA